VSLDVTVHDTVGVVAISCFMQLPALHTLRCTMTGFLAGAAHLSVS
jgi:hypothetical protein